MSDVAKNVLDTLIKEGCIVHEPFIDDRGLPADQKINLDVLPVAHPLYQVMVDRIGMWATGQGCQLLASEFDGSNRFAASVSHNLKIPFIAFEGSSDGTYQTIESTKRGRKLMETAKVVGIINNVRSTGISTNNLAGHIGTGRVRAVANIDRGIDVAGVHTPADAIRYAHNWPERAPAHVDTTFPYQRLFAIPLPLIAHYDIEAA